MGITDKLKNSGLKITPQRQSVYEAMMHLQHATIENIIAYIQDRNQVITISTIYRILDSFCKAGVLALVCHSETGECYYDINATEHHHVFDDGEITDFIDPELTHMIQEYLVQKHFSPKDIKNIQVQITLNKHNV